MKFFYSLLILLYIATASAETYYISQNDGNDAFNGLFPTALTGEQGPFATIGAGINQAGPGDTVLVRNGHYSENIEITTSGTVLAPILIAAYGNEIPSMAAASWDGSYALTLKNVSYITIQGLEFKDCLENRRPVLLDSSQYNTINHCNFINNGGVTAIHIVNGSAYNEISDCGFDDTGNDERIWDAHILLESAGDHNRILRNLFAQTTDLTERGVWCARTSFTDITGNTFSDLSGTALSVGIEPDEYTDGESIPRENNITYNTFSRNSGICCMLGNTSNNTVYGCEFENNTGESALSILGTGAVNNTIEHNTFFENGSLAEEYSMHIAVDSAGTGNRIIDNTITGDPDASLFSINSGFSGINIQNTSGITVQNNHIESLSYPATIDKRDYNQNWIKLPGQGGRAGHGIYIEGSKQELTGIKITGNQVLNCGASGISLDNVNNSQVNANRVNGCGAWGISVSGQRNVVEDNTAANNGWMHGGCSGVNIHGRSIGNTVRRNLSMFNKQGTSGEVGADWWSDGNGIIADQGADSTLIYNNISFGNDGAGIAITGSRFCSVLYNTVVANGYCEHAGHKAGLAIVTTLSPTREVKAETVIGNILYNNALYQMSIADVANHSHIMHHNLFNAGLLSQTKALIHYRDEEIPTWQRDFDSIADFRDYWDAKNNSTNAAGSVDGNPLLLCGSDMPEEALDVHPVPGSPARQAGVSMISQFTTDYTNTQRSTDQPWDLGAYYIDNQPSEAFSLISPGNGTTIQTATPTMNWYAAVDPDPGDVPVYHLVIRNVTEFGAIVVDRTQHDTLYNIVNELSDGCTYRWSVTATDYDGHQTECRQEFDFSIPAGTGIDGDDSALPDKLALYQNYPNPFNGSTTVTFDIPKAERVRISIFNMAGEKVKTLLRARMAAGTHKVQWHGRNDHGAPVSSGMYWVRLRYGSEQVTRRLVYIR